MAGQERSVAVIIRDPRGRFFMQFRDENAPGAALQFGCFGGQCEDGEGVIDAAVRELGEEIDEIFDPSDLKILEEYPDEDGGIRYLVLLTRRFEPERGLRVSEGSGVFLTPQALRSLHAKNMLADWLPGCFDRHKLW